MLSTASHALGSKPREHFSAWSWLNPAALQIVVTAIERLPRQSKFFKEIRHDVFHELVTSASGVSRHLVKLSLYFGRKVDIHSLRLLLSQSTIGPAFAAQVCCDATPAKRLSPAARADRPVLAHALAHHAGLG